LQGLSYALSLLAEILSDITNNPRVDQGLIQWAGMLKADLKYLQTASEITKAEIEDLRSMVRLFSTSSLGFLKLTTW
jgi:hypothetical protein